MRLKSVMRWSPQEKVFRVCRLLWTRGVVGDGKGYSAKLSLALRPSLLSVNREYWGLTVTLLGVRVHYQRRYGGCHT